MYAKKLKKINNSCSRKMERHILSSIYYWFDRKLKNVLLCCQ